jgi:hypothetical protein
LTHRLKTRKLCFLILKIKSVAVLWAAVPSPQGDTLSILIYSRYYLRTLWVLEIGKIGSEDRRIGKFKTSTLNYDKEAARDFSNQS